MKVFGAVGIVILLAGCAHQPQNQQLRDSVTHPLPSSMLEKQSQRRQQLLNHYQRWKGTPYQYGGLSQQGVDCSGFVFLAFKKRLGKVLPRTTQQQLAYGQPISSDQLKVADLLFFKTSKKNWHVGIYLGNQAFMHASTSQGVTVSHLNNVYWQSKFRRASRVIP